MGSVFNPFSPGGILDGSTLGSTVYDLSHPNEVPSGQGRVLTQAQVEALSKSAPSYVPLGDFSPVQDLEQYIGDFSPVQDLEQYIQEGVQRLKQALPDTTISTGTKVAAALVALAIIVLVLKR